MTDLTEQWKKGELETNKYYYVRDISYILPAKLGRYDNQLYFSGNEVGYGYEENKELEVLAPVPSYEEWQASENYIDYLKQCISVYESKEKQHTDDAIAYNELAKENEELKEILERHKKATAKAQIRSCDLEIINAKLKELLKDARNVLKMVDTYYGDYDSTNGYLVINKIDEVLK